MRAKSCLGILFSIERQWAEGSTFITLHTYVAASNFGTVNKLSTTRFQCTSGEREKQVESSLRKGTGLSELTNHENRRPPLSWSPCQSFCESGDEEQYAHVILCSQLVDRVVESQTIPKTCQWSTTAWLSPDIYGIMVWIADYLQINTKGATTWGFAGGVGRLSRQDALQPQS